MNEKVILDLGYYNKLVRKAERIDTVERMIRKQRYLTFDDVLAILGVISALEKEMEIDDEAI